MTVGPVRSPALTALAALVLVSCSVIGRGPAPEAQSYLASLAVTDGISEEFHFEVPPGSVAVSILARGPSPDALIQLGSLVLDGAPTFLADPADRDAMATRFAEHEVMESDAGFVHEVQRGTYAFTYPFAPDWQLPAGEAAVTLLARDVGELEVEIMILSDSERTGLDVTVFSPGESRLSEPARTEVERIFGEAGLRLTWHDASLPAEVPAALTDVDDRTDGSPFGILTAAVADRAAEHVSLVIVDSLPGGLSGLTTGVPGPHDGSGTAVTVTFRSDIETGRLVAHEIAHLLGLRHLEDRSATGVVVQNPILDTRGDAFNLMQFGTHLTPGQIDVLRLSPLLRADGPAVPG